MLCDATGRVCIEAAPAIADQSTTTDDRTVWFLIASTFILLGITWVLRQIQAGRRTTRRPAAPAHPAPRRCHTTGCRYPATVMVVQRGIHPQVAVFDVCQGCADEGTAHGWWFRLNVEPF